jgi:uncharacterized protein YjiS (DUF1127 family)
MDLSHTLQDLAMLPGSLKTAGNAPLTSPSVVKRDASSITKRRTALLFAGIRSVLRCALLEWQERVVDRNMLVSLDDRLLRDIGLTRGDVERELMKPFRIPR